MEGLRTLPLGAEILATSELRFKIACFCRNDQYRPIVFRNGRRVKFEDALQEARELGSSVEGTRCADNVRSGAQQHRPLRHP